MRIKSTKKIDLISKLSIIICGLIVTNVYASNQQCLPDGPWFEPSNMQAVESNTVLSRLTKKPILLMGEHHDNADHHAWHLQMLTQMHDKNNMVLGFEMLPRSKQSLLDQWVDGNITEKIFLSLLDWDEFWGFDIRHYLPIFRFAREKKIPMVALNLEKDLVKKIANADWISTDLATLYPVHKPANPPKNYIRQLAVSFTRHKFAPLSDVDKEQFHRFVKQQLIWDRVMAESIAETLTNSDNILFIGFAGSWHLINRFGIVFQLNSLGYNKITTLIPWDKNLHCDDLNSDFADYIYVSEQHHNN